MKYKCFAVRKGKKDRSIPLIETREGVLRRYLSETIKDVHKFHKWRTSAKKLCRNLGIDCNMLVLKEIKNRKEVGRYQIQHIYVNACDDDNRLTATIETQEIGAERGDEMGSKLFALIFFEITKNSDGKVVKISVPSKPIFSASPLMTDHLLS